MPDEFQPAQESPEVRFEEISPNPVRLADYPPRTCSSLPQLDFWTVILKSGVKFTVFMQIWPKTGIAPQKFMQQLTNFTNIASVFQRLYPVNSMQDFLSLHGNEGRVD